jgi:ABC-type nitrate/sulfonate/bicarbonate transport system permease component
MTSETASKRADQNGATPAGRSSKGAGRASRLIVLEPGAAERNPRAKDLRDKVLVRVLGVAIPVGLIALWQLAASQNWIDVRFFPAPSTIWRNWGNLLAGNLYWQDLWASVQRIVYGFLLGAGAGLLLGLAIGRLRILRQSLEPLIVGLYSIPTLAILPLLLLIFGIGETSKVMLIAISVFFVVLINTIGALENISVGHIEAGKSFGLGRVGMIRHVILPAALPQILVGLRLSAVIAVLLVIGAEFVAADRGLGYLIWNSWNIGIPSYMYIGIASIACLGLIANFLLRLLETVLIPWNR